MTDNPKTIEEARKFKYGAWAGNPSGNRYNSKRCAYEVWGEFNEYQCSRKKGHGINDLYCKQHAKKVREVEEWNTEKCF